MLLLDLPFYEGTVDIIYIILKFMAKELMCVFTNVPSLARARANTIATNMANLHRHCPERQRFQSV